LITQGLYELLIHSKLWISPLWFRALQLVWSCSG